MIGPPTCDHLPAYSKGWLKSVSLGTQYNPCLESHCLELGRVVASSGVRGIGNISIVDKLANAPANKRLVAVPFVEYGYAAYELSQTPE